MAIKHRRRTGPCYLCPPSVRPSVWHLIPQPDIPEFLARNETAIGDRRRPIVPKFNGSVRTFVGCLKRGGAARRSLLITFSLVENSIVSEFPRIVAIPFPTFGRTSCIRSNRNSQTRPFFRKGFFPAWHFVLRSWCLNNEKNGGSECCAIKEIPKLRSQRERNEFLYCSKAKISSFFDKYVSRTCKQLAEARTSWCDLPLPRFVRNVNRAIKEGPGKEKKAVFPYPPPLPITVLERGRLMGGTNAY